MRSSIILLYTELLIYVTKATLCYDDGSTFVKDDNFVDIKLSAGRIDTRTGIARYTKCETICKRYDHCVSYFYNSQTRVCELNSISYRSTERMEESTGTVYYRKLSECPSTPPVVTHSTHTFDDENIQTSEGSQLQYECETGYTQIGEVKCQKNGQWSAMSCVKHCPSTPPVVAHSTHTFDDANIQTSEGSQLQYECLDGYTQIGEVKCQKNGQWSTLSCAQDCPSTPPVVAHSTHSFDDANIQTSEGSQLQYECESGYTQIGEVTCQKNGQWSAMSCVKFCHTPSMLNAHLVSVDDGTYVDGDELEFNCNDGYIAENMNNKITCQSNGTWTSMRCNLIESCSEVHECNSTYPDGHYWIYPRNFGGERVKIYCYNMSGSPADYVTLPVENVAVYPNVSNEHCGASEKSCCSDYAGKTRYHKIRVNIKNMIVLRTVRTFATQDFGNPQPYGIAADCYSRHTKGERATCGPKATFNIDLTGTGLKVDPKLTFKLRNEDTSWGNITLNEDNTKIDMLCGGWCGGCAPDGPFRLEIYPPEEPEESSAITPSCEYP